MIVPISEKIREKLKYANMPFCCNDYIGDLITESDLNELEIEVKEKIEAVLHSLLIDTQNDHNTKGTAKRMAKMYIREVLSGRYLKQPTITEFPNAKDLDEIYIVSPISINSMCSHHFVPIMGELSIGIIPGEKLIGLSKFARLSQWMFSRGHIQEEAIVMLADKLEELIKPKGLAIILKAEHLCMKWRGVKQENTMMTSSIMRGLFMDNPNARAEFLTLLGSK